MQFINDRREMRSQSGFTLIELLVVIAILGILAAVVVFAVGGITDNGQTAACKIDLRTLKTAVQAYKAQNNVYPTAWADLTTNNAFLDENTATTAAAGALHTITFGATSAAAPTAYTAVGKCA
ncbi:MAG: prepilin-type N-terminal cleavage/methylation domain-containing protein [Acidimicrobiales bacterium]